MLFLQADQRARIECLAFAPDGRRLAVAGGGMAGVSVFDLYSGKVCLRYRGNRGVVRALAFSPGGELLGSADRHGQVKLWNAETGQDRASLAAWSGAVHCVAFSRDGRVFAAGSDSWVAAAQVRRWDVESGREMPSLRGHEGAITCLAFSPDGQLLATGSKDRTIRLWDAVSGLERTGFAARVVDFLRLLGWGRATEEQRGTMSDRDRRQIRALAFSPDSQLIAAATGHSATLFDIASGSVLTTYTSHKALLTEVAFSPDGRTLATASGDGTVKLWDVEDFGTFALRRRPTPRVTYDWEIGKVYSVAFCPDGTRVAASGENGRIVVWDLD